MWWFAKTKDMVPNHIVSSIDDRTMVVKNVKLFQLNLLCVHISLEDTENFNMEKL